MRSGHIKVKKGTHHLFYMAIARHTTESAYYNGCICLAVFLHDLGHLTEGYSILDPEAGAEWKKKRNSP